MSYSRTTQRQRLIRKLFLLRHRFVTEHELGKGFFGPLDILIQPGPLRAQQPDLLYVSNERAAILGQIKGLGHA
jgi:hypothetical protein